jgi:hypothetical protein
MYIFRYQQSEVGKKKKKSTPVSNIITSCELQSSFQIKVRALLAVFVIGLKSDFLTYRLITDGLPLNICICSFVLIRSHT